MLRRGPHFEEHLRDVPAEAEVVLSVTQCYVHQVAQKARTWAEAVIVDGLLGVAQTRTRPVHDVPKRCRIRIRIYHREVGPPNGLLLVGVLHEVGDLLGYTFAQVVLEDVVDAFEVLIRHLLDDAVEPRQRVSVVVAEAGRLSLLPQRGDVHVALLDLVRVLQDVGAPLLVHREAGFRKAVVHRAILDEVYQMTNLGRCSVR